MCNSEETNQPFRKPSLVRALREESQTWSPAEWESYLATLEVPRRETLTKEYDDLAESLVAVDPEEPRLTEEAMARLQAAIDHLSPKQKAVIKAKFWEGLSEHEIAKRFGIARTTVQMHLARGTSRLKWLMSSKFPLSERTKNYFPHNACPARTKTSPEGGEKTRE